MTAKEYIEFVNISQPDLFVTPSEMVYFYYLNIIGERRYGEEEKKESS